MGSWTAIQVLNKSLEYAKHSKHVNIISVYNADSTHSLFLGDDMSSKVSHSPIFNLMLVQRRNEHSYYCRTNAWEQMKLITAMKKYGGDFEWTSLGKEDEEYMGFTMLSASALSCVCKAERMQQNHASKYILIQKPTG
jgi:hypothetical protein